MASRKSNKRKSKNTIRRKKGLKFNRRSLLRLGITMMLAIPAYVAFSAYSGKQEQLHDLSIIGQGNPVLVQIHDPQCGQCRTLLSSVNAVLDEFPGVEFRIANYRSDKGYKFSLEHNVSYTTLLYFNDKGRKKDVAFGLQQEQEVRSFLKSMHSG